MAFPKKMRTEEEQRLYDEKQERRSPVFIYHYCLNENLPKEHPDFCFNCWIDECEKQAMAQQNWKYCPDCEAKGFPKFTLKDRENGIKIKEKMVAELEKHKQENMSELNRVRGQKIRASKLAKNKVL